MCSFLFYVMCFSRGGNLSGIGETYITLFMLLEKTEHIKHLEMGGQL